MQQAVHFSSGRKLQAIPLFPFKKFQRSKKHFCACLMFQCVQKLSVAMGENVLDQTLRSAHVPQDLAELSAKKVSEIQLLSSSSARKTPDTRSFGPFLK